MDAHKFAQQSYPDDNPQFRRAWGVPIACGDDTAPLRAWHASDVRPPPMTRQRRAAEAVWKRITRGIAP